MKTKIKILFALLSLVSLMSCVGSSKYMIKKDSVTLVNPDDFPTIIISAPYSFMIVPSDDANGNFAETKRYNRQITMLPGEYKAIGQSKDGTFYGGPPFCLNDTEYKPRWCGVFINNTRPELGYIFYHLRTGGNYGSVSTNAATDPYGISSGLATGLHMAMDERDLNHYTLMHKYPIPLSRFQIN